MATDTSAELDVFDCNLGEKGLDEFDPEPQRIGSRQRIADPARAEPQWGQPYIAPLPERPWLFAVPVIGAALLLGAALAWTAVRPSAGAVSGQVPAQPPSAPTPKVSVPSPPLSAPAVERAGPERVGPGAPPPVPAAAPEPEPRGVEPAIEQTLARVSDAYRALDAASLATVWPGANTSSLSEAFAGLRYQTLTFERCRTQRHGSDEVVATCEVSIASASQSGDPALQRRRESWTLALSRGADDQWMIAGVTVR